MSNPEAPAAPRTFYRSRFVVEVLSEYEPLAPCASLEDIDYAITHGECCGRLVSESSVALTPEQAAGSLIAFGSQPEFFQLEDLDIDFDAAANEADALQNFVVIGGLSGGYVEHWAIAARTAGEAKARFEHDLRESNPPELSDLDVVIRTVISTGDSVPDFCFVEPGVLMNE